MITAMVGTMMRGAAVAVVALGLCACGTDGQADERMETAADVERAMRELSNQGRWGEDDEIGAANFITPEKRKRAAALVQEGITVSLAHDVVEEEAVDATTILNREVLRASETGGSDRLQYTGSYHGYVHSHLDSLDCHVMVDGVGHTGATLAAPIEEAGGCPSGSISRAAQRDAGSHSRDALVEEKLVLCAEKVRPLGLEVSYPRLSSALPSP